ncbi:MAG: DegT/DnrJ/EryC1/StrS family aminotransferase [bacterium]|nr:DegT/DnrJ/EryC1/StrS family aminotransferase [bacterium]
MRVKMLDLTREYRKYRKEYVDAINSIFDKGNFILGEDVSNLEKSIAEYVGVKYGIGVGNGTDALLLSLKAAGIKEEDEVITTPFTFFATVETILQLKGVPVFVDINYDDFTMDLSQIEKKITKKTKAILPVHIFGHPADMVGIEKIAKKYGLLIIEDCAQSLGARIGERKCGNFGIAGTVSFFPTKNIGCAGDGGMVFTDSEDFYRKVKSLRVHGSTEKYIHEELGYNSRLDTLQAALLMLKMKRIEQINGRRREIAKNYNLKITDKVKKPFEKKGYYHIYHQYSILTEKRDKLKDFLKENGIDSTIYYPLPLHKQNAVLNIIKKEYSLPVSEEVSRKILSLPIYPELEDEEVFYIIEKINQFYD